MLLKCGYGECYNFPMLFKIYVLAVLSGISCLSQLSCFPLFSIVSVHLHIYTYVLEFGLNFSWSGLGGETFFLLSQVLHCDK